MDTRLTSGRTVALPQTPSTTASHHQQMVRLAFLLHKLVLIWLQHVSLSQKCLFLEDTSSKVVGGWAGMWASKTEGEGQELLGITMWSPDLERCPRAPAYRLV